MVLRTNRRKGEKVLASDINEISDTINTLPPAAWGSISGTLSSQSDLQSALNAKADDSDLAGYVPTTRTVNGEALSGNITLDQDDIGDGTTNKQYSQTEKTKLAGIETAADVTDSANVDAAGAVMNADTSTASMGFVLDEDNMASNSATKLPTQQSVKAYVDATVVGGGGGGTDWGEITGTLADQTDLQSALDLKVENLGDLGVTASSSELNILDGVTADAGEINKLDGLLPTTTELNYVDGVTSGLQTQLDGKVPTSRTVNGAALSGNITLTQDDIGDGSTYKQYSSTEKTKLAGIETAADVTDATNVAAAGAFIKSVDDADDVTEGSTHKFLTGAERTKLSNTSGTNTGDQDLSSYATTSAVAAAYQPLDSDLTALAALTTPATKLAGIEAGADVTDAANVTAAGAFMKSVDDLDDLTAGTTNKHFTDTEKTKLAAITGTNTGDQTSIVGISGTKSQFNTAVSDGDIVYTDNAALTDTRTPSASSITTAMFAGATLVTAAEGLASSDNDTSIPTTAAVIDAVAAGGGGGISNVVEDTSPQLGGNLDLNSFTVGAATAADLTKLNALTATSTELNYVDGVTSDIQTQLGTKVPTTRTINGADLSANRTFTTADIADSSNKRYVTDANLTVIGNTSGTNTGDQNLSSYATTAAVAAAYQPLDGDLTTIAGLTPTTDNFMVAASSAWASRTPAQARTSLGLVIGTNVQAWDADLDTWATKTPPSGTVVGTTDTQTLADKTLTTPKIARIHDANGNIMLDTNPQGSAVNYFRIWNKPTGDWPELQVVGPDTNIGYYFTPKGNAPIGIWMDTGQATAIVAGTGVETNVSLNLTSKNAGTVQANGVPVVTTTGTQTLSGKRVTRRTSSTTSTTSWTIDSDAVDFAIQTALAGALTVNAPTGTPTEAQPLNIRIKDNGTAQTISWNAAFVPIGVTLPTTTVLGKWHRIGCEWNTSTSKWDVTAVGAQA